MSGVYLICFVIFFMLFVFFALMLLPAKNKKKFILPVTAGKKNIFLFLIAFIGVCAILNVIFALIIYVVLFYFKYLYDRHKKQKYAGDTDKQIVETIRIFRNVVLSGQSLVQAADTVSKQVKYPLSYEFKNIYDKVGFGVSLDEALKESSINIKSEQYKLFIDALRISNTTGAKLSDILDKIEKSVSQRLAMCAKVEALTSQGKMSGNIISAVPLFIVLFVYAVEPAMMGVLFSTLIGNLILLISVIMMAAGSFLIRKISEIEL